MTRNAMPDGYQDGRVVGWRPDAEPVEHIREDLFEDLGADPHQRVLVRPKVAVAAVFEEAAQSCLVKREPELVAQPSR